MSRPAITFITGQHVRRCTHQIDKFFADYRTIQYMHSGSVSLRVGDEAYALNGRYFWSAYPGPRIAFRAAEVGSTWDHRYIAFDGPLVARWQEDGLFPLVPQAAPEDASLPSRFDQVLAMSQETGRWASIKAAHLLESILIELAENRDAAPAPPAWMTAVSRELEKEAAATVDYESLAEQFGISVRSLRRNFNRRLGVSPHQYLIEQRVRAAKDLLLRSDLPLKEIAQKLGYSDVFYFGRQFKRVAGVSPARFRRSREG